MVANIHNSVIIVEWKIWWFCCSVQWVTFSDL